jgi:TPR repeat protein
MIISEINDLNVPNTQGDETAEADEQLLEQAENGAVWAQKMLGFRYHSMGDYDKARKWLIKAALQGDVHSKILLMNTPS